MNIDQKTPRTPHTCVSCGEPCYIPFGLSPLCTNRGCQHYDEDTWVEHVLLLPDEETGIEFDLEDEDTQPRIVFKSPWVPLPSPPGGMPLTPALLPLDKLTDQELWARTLELEKKAATAASAKRLLADELLEVDAERARRKGLVP